MSKDSNKPIFVLILILVSIVAVFVASSSFSLPERPALSISLEKEEQKFELPITGYAVQRGATSVIGKRTDTFNFYAYLTKVESHYELLLQYRKTGDAEWKNYGDVISVENIPEKDRDGNTIIVRTIPDQNNIKEDGKYEFRFVAGPKDLSSSNFEFFTNTIFVRFISRGEAIDTELQKPVVIPASPSPNQAFELNCTVSTFVDCIDAFADGNKCTWRGEVTGDYRDGWEATSAMFKCGGLPAGEHEATCKTRTDTPDKCLPAEQKAKFTVGSTGTVSLSGCGDACDQPPLLPTGVDEVVYCTKPLTVGDDNRYFVFASKNSKGSARVSINNLQDVVVEDLTSGSTTKFAKTFEISGDKVLVIHGKPELEFVLFGEKSLELKSIDKVKFSGFEKCDELVALVYYQNEQLVYQELSESGVNYELLASTLAPTLVITNLQLATLQNQIKLKEFVTSTDAQTKLYDYYFETYGREFDKRTQVNRDRGISLSDFVTKFKIQNFDVKKDLPYIFEYDRFDFKIRLKPDFLYADLYRGNYGPISTPSGRQLGIDIIDLIKIYKEQNAVGKAYKLEDGMGTSVIPPAKEGKIYLPTSSSVQFSASITGEKGGSFWVIDKTAIDRNEFIPNPEGIQSEREIRFIKLNPKEVKYIFVSKEDKLRISKSFGENTIIFGNKPLKDIVVDAWVEGDVNIPGKVVKKLIEINLEIERNNINGLVKFRALTQSEIENYKKLVVLTKQLDTIYDTIYVEKAFDYFRSFETKFENMNSYMLSVESELKNYFPDETNNVESLRTLMSSAKRELETSGEISDSLMEKINEKLRVIDEDAIKFNDKVFRLSQDFRIDYSSNSILAQMLKVSSARAQNTLAIAKEYSKVTKTLLENLNNAKNSRFNGQLITNVEQAAKISKITPTAFTGGLFVTFLGPEFEEYGKTIGDSNLEIVGRSLNTAGIGTFAVSGGVTIANAISSTLASKIATTSLRSLVITPGQLVKGLGIVFAATSIADAAYCSYIDPKSVSCGCSADPLYGEKTIFELQKNKVESGEKIKYRVYGVQHCGPSLATAFQPAVAARVYLVSEDLIFGKKYIPIDKSLGGSCTFTNDEWCSGEVEIKADGPADYQISAQVVSVANTAVFGPKPPPNSEVQKLSVAGTKGFGVEENAKWRVV